MPLEAPPHHLMIGKQGHRPGHYSPCQTVPRAAPLAARSASHRLSLQLGGEWVGRTCEGQMCAAYATRSVWLGTCVAFNHVRPGSHGVSAVSVWVLNTPSAALGLATATPARRYANFRRHPITPPMLCCIIMTRRRRLPPTFSVFPRGSSRQVLRGVTKLKHVAAVLFLSRSFSLIQPAIEFFFF